MFPTDLDMAGGCLSNKDLRRLHFRVLGEVAGVSNFGHISGTRGVQLFSEFRGVMMARPKTCLARNRLCVLGDMIVKVRPQVWLSLWFAMCLAHHILKPYLGESPGCQASSSPLGV